MHIVVLGGAGEVGSAVAAHFAMHDHTVTKVSSRPMMAQHGFMSIDDAARLVCTNKASLVVNASGPGDIRGSNHAWISRASAVAEACQASKTPSVLISTTRVMEGYEQDYEENDPPRPRTEYGRGNALSEAFWLEHAGDRATVIRATNVFLEPSHRDSPQTRLLPWSLVLEGVERGEIVIRSSRSSIKYFISIADLCSAIEIVHQTQPIPRVVVTTPAISLTLSQLTDIAQRAIQNTLGWDISTRFGSDEAKARRCESGWLSEHHWESKLDPCLVQAGMESWLKMTL